MLVSIVTPSFNQVEFIDKTIRSVLAQDHPEIEYLIIDGGSDDGSVDIIRSYADRLSYWVSEPDHGQSDAINKGFRRCRGEIVAWLNSDDLYFPYAVSTAVRQFRKDPGLSVFYGDAVFIDRDSQFLHNFNGIEPFNRNRLWNHSDFIMQPATFFRRDRLFEVGLLRESLEFTMDWDLWCRFARAGCRFHYEPLPIAANRQYSETKSMSGSWNRIWEILRVVQRHSTSLIPHAFWNYFLDEAHRTINNRILRRLIRYLLLPLNFSNFLHARRERFRSKQGLFPNEGRVAQNSRFRIPTLDPVTEVRVAVSTRSREPDQTMDLRVDGRNSARHRFEGSQEMQTISANLPPGVGRKGYVDVSLHFSHLEGRNGFAGTLHKCALL